MNPGQEAEQRAADYLQGQGLRLLERNFRCRGGEIDLILEEGATLVFVEVRQRGSDAFGGAAGSITAVKQRRIQLAAQHYLVRTGAAQACRFDAVLIQSGRLEWLRAAFDAHF